MKKISIWAVFLFNCPLLFAQDQPTFSADKDSVAEQQVIQLEFLLTDLLTKGDISTYSTYLTDDYIRVAANGIVSTKAQVLDGFRKSTMQGQMIPHDLTVRVYGSTAILRAILDLDDKQGNRRTSIITKIFINRNGKWFMASLQGTSIQK